MNIKQLENYADFLRTCITTRSMLLKQYYFQNGKYLPYPKAYHFVKGNENFVLLPSQVAQQTMMVVDRSMKSFFRLLKERNKGNYNRPVSIPKYLPKDGLFICIFQKDMFKVVGTKIRLSLGKNFYKKYGIRYLEFKLPPTVKGKKIKEVRIVPRYKGLWFEIHYIYEDEPIKTELNYSSYLSIDLGINNFATCIPKGSAIGTPFIIEGKGLKSFNRWWNKEEARLQSIYDKQGIKRGKKMGVLLRKRRNFINNFVNQATNHIVKYCLKNKIGNIVIGEMKEIKHNIDLGKRNDQNIQNMPWGLFKQKLRFKCEYYNINFKEVDENSTSITCFKCGYKDKNNRKHRGLFVCKKCGFVANADVNGALNILRKVVPEAVRLGDSGWVSQPRRIRVVPLRTTKLLLKPHQ